MSEAREVQLSELEEAALSAVRAATRHATVVGWITAGCVAVGVFLAVLAAAVHPLFGLLYAGATVVVWAVLRGVSLMLRLLVAQTSLVDD